MSEKKENNDDYKSKLDQPIKIKIPNSTFFLFKNKKVNSQIQKSSIEKSSISLNFNYFNERNNLFSNSLDSKNFSSLLTRNEEEEEIKNESQNSKYSLFEKKESEKNEGDIFEILSQHLIYEGNESDNNENNVINDNKTYDQLEHEDKIILNNFLDFAKEQSSCRFLQNKIQSKPYLIQYFFPLILNNVDELIIHPYGNYLIQNIFYYLSQNEILEFLKAIKNNITNISKNFIGTRVIQKLIDFIHNENTMLMLLNSFSNYSKIINDVFASHIIIKLLSFKKIYIDSYIYEKINDDLITISMNKHGCCIIKKILEYKSSFNDTIINNIINNSLKLITDQYGHYIILYIIQSNMKSYKQKLAATILPNFIQLSIQIYSSTVIEKCFEFCEDDLKYMFYQCLMNLNTMKILICDKYGNYVVQKAILKTPNDNMRFYLFQIVSSIINDIQNNIFGRQFFVKLCKNYPVFKKFLQ